MCADGSPAFHALAWIWNAFITSVISGAGLFFIAVVVEYIKQYGREKRELQRQRDELERAYLLSQSPILPPSINSKGAAIFSSYRNSPAFLSGTAFSRRSPYIYQQNPSNFCSFHFDPTTSPTDYDWLTEPSSMYPDNTEEFVFPREEEHERFTFPNEQDRERVLQFQLQSTSTSLIAERIKIKHGIRSWSEINSVQVNETIGNARDDVNEMRNQVSRLCHDFANCGENSRGFNAEQTSRMDRAYLLSFQKQMTSNIITNYPFILPFLKQMFLEIRNNEQQERPTSSRVRRVTENKLFPILASNDQNDEKENPINQDAPVNMVKEEPKPPTSKNYYTLFLQKKNKITEISPVDTMTTTENAEIEKRLTSQKLVQQKPSPLISRKLSNGQLSSPKMYVQRQNSPRKITQKSNSSKINGRTLKSPINTHKRTLNSPRRWQRSNRSPDISSDNITDSSGMLKELDEQSETSRPRSVYKIRNPVEFNHHNEARKKKSYPCSGRKKAVIDKSEPLKECRVIFSNTQEDEPFWPQDLSQIVYNFSKPVDNQKSVSAAPTTAVGKSKSINMTKKSKTDNFSALFEKHTASATDTRAEIKSKSIKSVEKSKTDNSGALFESQNTASANDTRAEIKSKSINSAEKGKTDNSGALFESQTTASAIDTRAEIISKWVNRTEKSKNDNSGALFESQNTSSATSTRAEIIPKSINRADKERPDNVRTPLIKSLNIAPATNTTAAVIHKKINKAEKEVSNIDDNDGISPPVAHSNSKINQDQLETFVCKVNMTRPITVKTDVEIASGSPKTYGSPKLKYRYFKKNNFPESETLPVDLSKRRENKNTGQNYLGMKKAVQNVSVRMNDLFVNELGVGEDDDKNIALEDVIKKQQQLMSMIVKKKHTTASLNTYNSNPKFLATVNREATWNKTITRIRKAPLSKQNRLPDEGTLNKTIVSNKYQPRFNGKVKTEKITSNYKLKLLNRSFTSPKWSVGRKKPHPKQQPQVDESQKSGEGSPVQALSPIKLNYKKKQNINRQLTKSIKSKYLNSNKQSKIISPVAYNKVSTPGQIKEPPSNYKTPSVIYDPKVETMRASESNSITYLSDDTTITSYPTNAIESVEHTMDIKPIPLNASPFKSTKSCMDCPSNKVETPKACSKQSTKKNSSKHLKNALSFTNKNTTTCRSFITSPKKCKSAGFKAKTDKKGDSKTKDKIISNGIGETKDKIITTDSAVSKDKISPTELGETKDKPASCHSVCPNCHQLPSHNHRVVMNEPSSDSLYTNYSDGSVDMDVNAFPAGYGVSGQGIGLPENRFILKKSVLDEVVQQLKLKPVSK